MTLSEFYTKYIGKSIDTDGFPSGQPNQCVDMVKQYMKDCFDIPFLAYGNAVDYWTNPHPNILAKFDKIATSDFKDSDIVIWGQGAKTTVYGHIAVWYNGQILNQNYGKPYVTLNPFFSSGFLGVLRPKIKGDIMDKETVNLMYMLAENIPASEFRLNFWNGKPTKDLAKALYEVDNKPVREKLASIPALEKAVAELDQLLDDSHANLANLNKVVTENNAKIKDLQAQINDLTSLSATEIKLRQKAENEATNANNALKTAQEALQSKDAEITELKTQAETDNQSDIEEALKSIKKQEELTAELRAQEIINKALEEKQKADNLTCIKNEQSVSIVKKFFSDIVKLLTRKGK